MNQPTITTTELLARQVSWFERISGKPAKPVTAEEVLDLIRSGHLKTKVSDLRRINKEKGKESYHAERTKCLPAVTFSGVFEGGHRKDQLRSHSGLLVIDFDNLGAALAAKRQELIEDPHTLAVFVSPSGDGLKALVGTTATDQRSHYAAYAAAGRYLVSKGLEADAVCKDPGRLCYLSWDPEAWVRPPSSSLFLFTASEPEPVTVTVSIPIPIRQVEGGGTDEPEPEPVPISIRQEGGAPGASDELSGRVASIKRLTQLRETDPVTAELYENHVLPHVIVAPGKRNDALTQLVPALFRMVGEDVAKKLACQFLEINREVFTGNQEEHMASMKSLWEGCAKAYQGELTPPEAQLYEALPDSERQAFRILRDLARCRGGEFFMSCNQLERRLGDGSNGHRMLRRFENAYGLIEQTKPGKKWAAGVKALAGQYRWLMASFSATGEASKAA